MIGFGNISILFSNSRIARALCVIVALTISLVAEAGLLGPNNYYIVQKDIDLDASFFSILQPLTEPPKLRLTLRQGQVVKLDGFMNAVITVESLINGRRVEGEIRIPAAYIRQVFGEALNPSNQVPEQFLTIRPTTTTQGYYIRLDDSPDTLNGPATSKNAYQHFIAAGSVPPQTASGGTIIDLEESRYVDYGTADHPRLRLVHRVCLKTPAAGDHCGWIQNEALSRGDSTHRYNWVTGDGNQISQATGLPMSRTNAPAAANSPVASDCDGDSLRRLATVSASITAAIRQLPSQEQLAREKIQKAIGICALNPPTLPAAQIPTAKLAAAGTNSYDGLARATTLSAFAKVSAAADQTLVRERGSRRPMTRNDFLSIDVLARSLFSEIRGARCQQKPYMAAVARMILNRTLSPNKKMFLANSTSLAGGPILKVILANQQFSEWNTDSEISPAGLERHKGNLKKALCPMGQPTNADEQAAWQKAVDLAMHAVLEPQHFLDETASFGSIEFFRSGKVKPPGYTSIKPPPKIDGQELDDPSCLTFWKVSGT